MKRTTRTAIAAAAVMGAGAAGLYGVSEFMFRLSLDMRYSHWMERLMAGGAAQGYLATPHRDADEETSAARWFDSVRQPVSMRSEDGLKLHGWLFDPDRVPAAPHLYAVLMHGYAGGPADMAKYAHRFARMGFTVLVPAQRGHELSEGRYVGMGWLERRDLLGWLTLVTASDPEARILLFGVSMGAAMMNALCSRRAGYGFREASCVRSLRRTIIPMMFIHGAADTFVDPAFLDRNIAACASIDRERLLVPGAGHALGASTDPDLYWKRVTAFVKRVFDLR